MKSIAPYTRPGLIESIATANALAMTADETSEYLHWTNREMDLRALAGHITPSEQETIAKISQTKRGVYDGECA